MCGLAGFLDFGGLASDSSVHLSQMTRSLRHRGPDDRGEWLDSAAGIALGSTRLSIVELSPLGHMPMTSSSGRYVIVYNGEIYNFRALREELSVAGSVFRGGSDTEVLLAAVERWGLDGALPKFAGMFAFALWDRQERSLTLCRDRIGEKPLYWSRQGSLVMFGSELKALRAHPAWRGGVDRGVLASYLRSGYVSAPYTIHPEARKLVPGTCLTFRAGQSEPREIRYWTLQPSLEAARLPAEGDMDSWAARLDDALRGAIRDEMLADVPVGAFLSGGIDSSLITALMQSEGGAAVKTFTIGFREDAFDEADYARAVARHLGTEHTELTLTPDEALAVVPGLHEVYDEPFGDVSQIPTLLVSSLARSRVTVCLSGDGGDELFGGYDRYHWSAAVLARMRPFPGFLRQAAARGIESMPAGFWNALAAIGRPVLPSRFHPPDFERKLREVADMIAAPGAEAFYLNQLSLVRKPEELVVDASEPLTTLSDPRCWPDLPQQELRMMYVDQLNYLPDDILVKVDRASMARSLEVRAPMLDHRIVELAWKIPVPLKFSGGSGKRILKHLLAKYVPVALTDRPKQGFGVPMGAWLRGPLRGWAERLLAAERLADEGWLRPAPVRRLWQEHLDGRADRGSALWHVLMFQRWLEASAR